MPKTLERNMEKELCGFKEGLKFCENPVPHGLPYCKKHTRLIIKANKAHVKAIEKEFKLTIRKERERMKHGR